MSESNIGAIASWTQIASIGQKKIAYRTVGSGKPMILCNRLRGILDSWDPAFLDELAKSFQVVIFDYSGVGSSGGELAPKIADVAADVGDLATFLNFDQFFLVGWSYGGAVAQTYATRNPESVDALILLGANPPGTNGHPLEQAFLDATFRVVNDLEDETLLFFEPASPASRLAAERSVQRIAARTVDRDMEVPEQTWPRYFEGIRDFVADEFGAREKLAKMPFPILVISGDHDPACPVENWYALSRKLPNMQLIMLGASGHGPQHQHPALAVEYINSFIRHTQE